MVISHPVLAADSQTPTVSQPYPTAHYVAHFQKNIMRGMRTLLHQLPPEPTGLPDETKALAFHLLSYALKSPTGWPEVRALLLALAPRLEQAGHRDDWLPYLEQGLQQSLAQRDDLATAELALHIGSLHYRRSRFAEADNWLTRSYDSFAQQKNYSGQGTALNRLALVAVRSGQPQRAEAQAQQALSCLPSDAPECANSYAVLGEVARERRLWAAAESYDRRALAIWQRQGNQREIARGLRNLGPALREQAKLDEAIACYEQALALFATIHDPVNQAVTEMNLGILYSMQQQHGRALPCHQAAERIFRLVQDQVNLAKVYTNMGVALRALGDYPQAIQVQLAGIQIRRQLGQTRWLYNALDGLGLTYLANQDFAKAIETFQHALSQVSQMANDPGADRLHELLTTHLQQARHALEKAESVP